VAKVGSEGAGTHFVILTTIGPDGKVVPTDRRLALRNKANQLWHTDASFKRVPRARVDPVGAHHPRRWRRN
jgi:alpha-ketoglutarate-dependent 2,4-dichlorophenoxyacetate dioxygenase